MSLQMPVFTAPYAPDDGELAADLLAEAPLDREAEGRAHAPRHPRLRLPRDLFAPERINAAGLDFGDRAALEACSHRCRPPVRPLVDSVAANGVARDVFSPIDAATVVGTVLESFAARRPLRDLDTIAASGYGLTLGIHSRIDATAARIVARLSIGNVYINRNMIGAVVGVQPFGGLGLSGTGPKAGGPHYLPRFAAEQTIAVNTAAAGGDAVLVALQN